MLPPSSESMHKVLKSNDSDDELREVSNMGICGSGTICSSIRARACGRTRARARARAWADRKW